MPGLQGRAAYLRQMWGQIPGIAAAGDIADIGADWIEGKAKDANIKTGNIILNTVLKKKVIDKIPLQKVIDAKPMQKLGQEAIDTYVGRDTGVITDAVVNSTPKTGEESDKLDLKIETKK